MNPDEPEADPYSTQTPEDFTPEDAGRQSDDSAFESKYSTRVDQSLVTFGDVTLPKTADDGDNAAPASHQSAIGTRLRFRVLRPHAKGGLGQVSLAQDNELKRQVAIKEIQARFADLPGSQARFIFEAEVTGRLEHPGVVPVYALGRNEDGRPFYAMRFISGSSMNEAITELYHSVAPEAFDRRLRDLLNRFISVCNTIEYAHSRGYVHRDLKPANIMLGAYAETLVVDWGLAKQIGTPDIVSQSTTHTDNAAVIDDPVDLEHKSDRAKTRSGSTVGTPQYMAPEQAAGDIEKIGPHTDIYCLGATLYHILTGSAPLADQDRMSMPQLIQRVCRGDIPPPIAIRPAIRKTLNAICCKAMSVAPEHRYATARQLAEDLENELADQPVSVLPEGFVTRASRWTRKHRGVTATIGLSLLLLTVLSTAFYAVTRSTLDRTRRYLQISQLEQQFDTAIHAETQRQRDAIHSDVATTPDGQAIQKNAAIIQEIETLRSQETPRFVDLNRRRSLLQSWNDGIEQLSRQRMDRDLHSTLVSEVQRLKNTFPFPQLPEFDREVERLNEMAMTRIGQWYALPLPDLSAPDFELRDGIPTRVPEAANDAVFAVLETPPGNIQVSVGLIGDTTQAQIMGVRLADTMQPPPNRFGYQFLLADQSYHPVYGSEDRPTIAEAIRRNSLTAFIIRGEEVLRVQPVELTARIDGGNTQLPKLTARRERGTLLTFAIDEQIFRFDDLFPLPTDHASQIELICPPGFGVRELRVEAQRDRNSLEQLVIGAGTEQTATARIERPTPIEQNPIEQGDRAFASGDFLAARQYYQQLPKNVEALMKTALTLEFIEPAEYPVVLKRIIEEHAPEGVDDENARQWYLYAGVKLFMHYLQQPDEQTWASWVLTRLRVNYDLEDVQSLIPEAERESFSQALLKPGKRTRVLFGNEGDLEDLEGVIELFSNNTRWRRLAHWRKTDRLRYDWKLPPADARAAVAPILDRLIEEMATDPDADTLDWITMIRDRVWLHILDHTYADGKALLVRAIGEKRERIPTNLLPLLIDRARLIYAENNENATEAMSDLQFFLDRVDPQSPPAGVHPTHYAEACGVYGILKEREGENDAAEELWLKGRRRNWGPWRSDPAALVTAKGALMVLETETPEPILAARTDGYSTNEWKQVVEELFAGSGLSDVAIRNMIFNSEQVPQEWIATVAEKAFSGSRGRAIGDASLLHQIPMMQTNTGGVTLILYQAVVHLTMGGEAALQKYPELDEILFDRCGRLMSAFQQERIAWKEMGFVIAAFTGSWNERAYVRLAERLDDPDLSAGFALIFALMQQVKNDDLKKSREIVQKFVLPNSDELPSVYRTIAIDRLGPFE
jgi:serine/threonine protein kinase